ncbi:murein hydrolase activator EnvC family protein [Faecalicatena contorta]|uniref:Septal ring factor EnvC, activator of murein hydrolases AmiA and AmiB n=1 Tax=Faecalicatena contorta TaxID=39482 RepID=A0A316A1K0_9FIRM|nr:M23 family metallopeptidase [Faecalicatena contorta]PWJ51515.1 septal ring factor EnvC (AmiA/AmiB activator) [Faecalicatena contorta]SUQ13071.1 Septal ring factor EnvC, activator of murein hydrolases AmiA and AmiB [Faecalicatena contorta]
MNRRKKSIISAVLIMVLCTALNLNVNATTVEEAQRKADELESKKKSAEEEKNSLASQLSTIVSDMNTIKEKLEKKQTEIQTAENELVEAKIDENNQYESMKKRIRFMYENGNSQFLEILLECESISDFLNKAEYFSQISTYDRNMLTEFQNVVKEVEEKEATLEKEYAELSGLQDELIKKQDEVQSLLDSKKIQIADLENQIGDNAATLEKLVKEAEAERQKQLQQQAAIQAAQQQAANNGSASGGGGSYAEPDSTPVVSGNGQFTNPCPGGYVSSTFGYRDFDASFHKGLDLAAAEGTPTYAAAGGTVITAGWSDSAGNWVVINHGNGLTTKYMHHSALCVSEGQVVAKGQQIGYVGNTGNSFGAHLHFQVEINGAAVDPQGYL